MAAWRMAFRCGTKGFEMWPQCHRCGVAIIEYTPVDNIDLSRYAPGEPRAAWSQLSPSQQTSLRHLVHDMAKGDVIYVKQGPKIVGKGTVTGPYRFDRKDRIKDPEGVAWQHQRPVSWAPGFPEVALQVGKQQIMTVVPLDPADVERVELAATACFANISDIEGTITEALQLKTQRSRKLRDLALLAARGVCCVCNRNYSTLLGGRGVRVLQVHHREQLAMREVPSETKLSDLAVVCANCHLLLHLDPKNALPIEALRKMLKADGFI